MANTKIPVELSSTPGIVDNSNATAITIDSSENVGIGTTSPSARLTVDGGTSADQLRLGTDPHYYKIGRNSVSGPLEFYGTQSGVTGYVFGGVDGERLRIDDSGNVGIGTSSPTAGVKLHVTNATQVNQYLESTGNATNSILQTGADGNSAYVFNRANAGLTFGTNNTERMRIDSSGNVGIGASPVAGLHIQTSTRSLSLAPSATGGGGGSYILMGNSDSAGVAGPNVITSGNRNLQFGVGDDFSSATGGTFSEYMRIDSSGNVGIGTSSPTAKLHVEGSSGDVYIQAKRASQSQGQIALELGGGVGGTNWVMYQPASSDTLNWYASGGNKMTLTTGGALSITGALSKGSGSFRIDHPLESKKDTHELVHSFIEGPQADNIYRGKVDLVDGSATVNIDTVAGMTEGTFVALNTEVQCFTSNESDWDAVKGSVLGNILTIECQNTSSTATVSWLVIGERQDQHMYDTDWTDDNGKVIVEPLKTNEE